MTVTPTHPFFDAVELANRELSTGAEAARIGNHGRARVCGRRAVGTFLQSISERIGIDFGSNAMANLRAVGADARFPATIREAAERLLGGARSTATDAPFSEDPLADAGTIINYFVASASS